MDEVSQNTVEYYNTSNEKVPFEEWFQKIPDDRTKAIIRKRIDRLSLGNFGDCKPLGSGLFELRVHFGQGYRIYFGRKGFTFVVLLLGGEKRMQRWDIMRAKHYWADYQEREK